MLLRLVICPTCGRIQPRQGTTEFRCSSCEIGKMEPIKLTFSQYTRMTPKERKDYVTGWMYIRRTKEPIGYSIFREDR